MTLRPRASKTSGSPLQLVVLHRFSPAAILSHLSRLVCAFQCSMSILSQVQTNVRIQERNLARVLYLDSRVLNLLNLCTSLVRRFTSVPQKLPTMGYHWNPVPPNIKSLIGRLAFILVIRKSDSPTLSAPYHTRVPVLYHARASQPLFLLFRRGEDDQP